VGEQCAPYSRDRKPEIFGFCTSAGYVGPEAWEAWSSLPNWELSKSTAKTTEYEISNLLECVQEYQSNVDNLSGTPPHVLSLIRALGKGLDVGESLEAEGAPVVGYALPCHLVRDTTGSVSSSPRPPTIVRATSN
jgi:hypothetical protein